MKPPDVQDQLKEARAAPVEHERRTIAAMHHATIYRDTPPWQSPLQPGLYLFPHDQSLADCDRAYLAMLQARRTGCHGTVWHVVWSLEATSVTLAMN